MSEYGRGPEPPGRREYENRRRREYEDRQRYEYEQRGREKGDKRKSKKKGGAGTVVIIVIAVIVLVVALFNIFYLVESDMRSSAAYNALRGYTAEKAAVKGEEPADGAPELMIDFDALHNMNEDIIAWIVVPGTPIDFPVTQTDDNTYYLSHSADKSENRNGAVFMEKQNKPDFSDQNTIIYGHNMKSGAMFARLHNFEEEEFFNTHPNFYIYTPDGKKHTYRIFSAYQAKASGSTYDLSFEDGAAFEKYIANAKEKSVFKRDVDIEPDDKIVTLYTCVTDARQNRYILQGVLVEDEDVQAGQPAQYLEDDVAEADTQE